MKKIPALAAFCATLAMSGGPPEARGDALLADDFSAAGDHAAAALEWRRAAADTDDDSGRAAAWLLAADAYRMEKDWRRLSKMLDKAEDAGAADSAPALSLRLQLAESRKEWSSASLYAEALARKAGRDGDERLRRWAQGAQAADALMAGDAAEARAAAADDPARIQVADAYAEGRDKSPRLGGWLGIVPGLGYAYSGEWGNCLRSLFLNGLFGWAMVECADRDEWGLFAVTAFFETTWWTGSIYGGIDAAHRFNRERLESAASQLRGADAPPTLRHGPAADLFHVKLEF